MEMTVVFCMKRSKEDQEGLASDNIFLLDVKWICFK